MKRLFSSLIVLSLLSFATISCSADKGNTHEAETEAAEAAETPAAEEAAENEVETIDSLQNE